SKKKLAAYGFDARSIAENGWDKIWKKQGVYKSALVFGSTENISAASLRELVEQIDRPLTLEEIRAGIRAYFKRTGKRLTAATGWIDELRTTSSCLRHRLEKCFSSSITLEVRKLFGGNDDLLERCRRVIEEYMLKGIRLKAGYGYIPE